MHEHKGRLIWITKGKHHSEEGESIRPRIYNDFVTIPAPMRITVSTALGAREKKPWGESYFLAQEPDAADLSLSGHLED